MSEFVFKLPDLGEGTVEAEIVEWHVKPGDSVTEGDTIADVMTDKANVEVPAPVSGVVLRTTGEPGDMVAVGNELIAIETAGKEPSAKTGKEPSAKTGKEPSAKTGKEPSATLEQEPSAILEQEPSADLEEKTAAKPAPESGDAYELEGEKVRTSPAVRRRAKEAGVSLSEISGSGPRGRILRRDLEAVLDEQTGKSEAASLSGVGPVTERKVIGVRRVIATRLQASKREIPHFAYVEEVDVTALEALRQTLNRPQTQQQASLTFLPFIALALMRALKDHPNCNAHFDSERGVLLEYERVHLGIATQTPDGLKVPVVHNAGSLALRSLAAEITRIAEAARDGSASRSELSGSTITLTSLGRLGGIVSTPVINAPEVAIIGVNKAVPRPMVVDGEVTIRLMMNLSSSFDHRFVDGFDAASLVQRVKGFLEQPATIFIQ